MQEGRERDSNLFIIGEHISLFDILVTFHCVNEVVVVAGDFLYNHNSSAVENIFKYLKLP